MSEALAPVAQIQPEKKVSLVQKMAARFSVDPGKMMNTLKATAFKVKDGSATDEQMMALLIVADQYGLNPFTREIYAFPDRQNGIVPVVGVDGWSRIINENQHFDGMDFEQDDDKCTCTIYRKDRSHPIKVTEYFSECRRDVTPWKTHPRRMLRHKAMIQCARLAFGYVGIFDQDEAERIVEGEVLDRAPAGKPVVAAVKSKSEAKRDAAQQPAEPSDPAPVMSESAAEFFGEGVPQ